jgi:hypothetical protein
MPRQQALTVIKRVTNDLRTGVPWSKVYERYSEEFNYPPKPDGSQRTKIGLERSHPAADASREVVERWLLDVLM